MTWQNLLLEFLLITATALSCSGKMLNNARGRQGSSAKSNSLRLLSNLSFTTSPYSQAEASSTQLPTQATHSVLKEKETTAEPVPSAANKIVGHIQENATVAPKMTSAKLTGKPTVVKAIVVARRTVGQPEPQADQIRIHRDSKQMLAPERTNLKSEPPNNQKTAPVIMANTNKTPFETSDNHITQTTAKGTSSMAHKNTTSVVSTAPIPATPHEPTLAPKPSPPATGAYHVSNGTANCIKALVGLTMIAKNRKTNKMEYFNIDPNTTRTNGTCGASLSVLKILFQGGFVSFTFNKNGEVYYVSMIEATLAVPSEGSPYTGIKCDQLFSAQVGNCFNCTSPQTVGLSDDFQLLVTNTQLQAFDIIGDQFGKVELCALDRKKKLIPATVILSLTGLIVIVVVTCMIYRRKPNSEYNRI